MTEILVRVHQVEFFLIGLIDDGIVPKYSQCEFRRSKKSKSEKQMKDHTVIPKRIKRRADAIECDVPPKRTKRQMAMDAKLIKVDI